MLQANVFELFLKHKNVRELNRSLLVELIETIYVHEDKKVTVVFRFANELKRVVEYVEENARKSGDS